MISKVLFPPSERETININFRKYKKCLNALTSLEYVCENNKLYQNELSKNLHLYLSRIKELENQVNELKSIIMKLDYNINQEYIENHEEE